MDEISQIYDISMQMIEFLVTLKGHCVNGHYSRLDEQGIGLEEDITPLIWGIDEAVTQIKRDNENLPRLINDLKTSLDVVTISSLYPQSVS